jgi:Cft2 family RNA processing exonuclease
MSHPAADVVRVTPIFGGKSDGPVCSLLEIGGARLLLDCGCGVDFNYEDLLNVANDLVSDGGVDAVVLRQV